MNPKSFQTVLSPPLILVQGKGGVGKTTLSQAFAEALTQQGKRVLWVTFESRDLPPGEIVRQPSGLSVLNCDPLQSFEEFISTKIKISALARLFVQNRMMRYLARVSPGIPGLVMLGKILFDVKRFEHTVVDMPATGHSLAMFHATRNFSQLFKGGAVSTDAKQMLEELGNPKHTSNVIVALPEEMPLQEALEFDEKWRDLFPSNASHFIANRLFPGNPETPSTDGAPLADSAIEYVTRRVWLEKKNLDLWKEKLKTFLRLPYVAGKEVPKLLAKKIQEQPVEAY